MGRQSRERGSGLDGDAPVVPPSTQEVGDMGDVGRIGGIHVKIHWSAALIALLVGASLANVIGVGLRYAFGGDDEDDDAGALGAVGVRMR